MTIPLHVALVGFRGIPHTYGGGEEFVLHLAPKLVERGLKVTVYCRSSHYRHDRAPEWRGVGRVFLPAPEQKALGQFVHSGLAVGHAALKRPDVVYVHTLPSGPHTILPWLLRQPIVVNVNGMDWNRDKWGRGGKAYFRASVSIVLRTATEIVNDSEAMRAYYLDRWGRDSRFIAYGAEFVRSERPEVVRQYQVEPGGYYLVASRLVPENNAHLIIEAHEKSGTSRPLLIAGGANYRNEWLDALRRRASDRVRFLGHIGDPDVVKELHCNAYAYLHGHSLGGTNPALLKALGAGNCILAYASVFNREVLSPAGGRSFGLLWGNADELTRHIQRIESDPDLAARMREAAPDRIREAYTWDLIADQYAALFREVAKRRTS